MPVELEENVITTKTQDLCRAIVEHLELSANRRRIDAFLADAGARGQYEAVTRKAEALQEKQSQGQPLDGGEIADFEKHREALLNNPIARDFLEAREELHKIQHSIQKHVSKTLELGRVPTATDLEEGACGQGCGCHH
ncbi:MAG: YlbF family regulator [Verrucomicrobiota bacterium]|nr:YlbF family regulator [Verrucomicrobiota bacterium]